MSPILTKAVTSLAQGLYASAQLLFSHATALSYPLAFNARKNIQLDLKVTRHTIDLNLIKEEHCLQNFYTNT
jgi:hypothetical protein